MVAFALNIPNTTLTHVPSFSGYRTYPDNVIPLQLLDRSPSHTPDKENLKIHQALDLLQKTNELPSIETFISVLQRCRKSQSLAHARRAHLIIHYYGLESDITLGNFLVPMLVECGNAADGEQIFHKLALRNEHSWTSIIQGYLECGSFIYALDILPKMWQDDVFPSKYTFVLVLKASAVLKSLETGREIHLDIVNIGLETDLFIGNTTVDFYAKCGFIEDAQDVFDRLTFRDVVSWNALMAGYAELGHANEVLECLDQMKQEGIFGDAITFLSCLKACSNHSVPEKVFDVHFDLVTEGCETDTFIRSTLIGVYAKLGLLIEAQELFDELPVKDIISWTSLITGYADKGLDHQALLSIGQLFRDGINVDSLTVTCCLKISGDVGIIDNIQEIHTRIMKDGLEQEPFVGSTLVSVYAKCGLFIEAWDILKELADKDVVSWTALITGYIDQALPFEALECFRKMQSEGVLPNTVTYICTLKACSKLKALEEGREFHAEIMMKAVEEDLCLQNALVDMYAKCGLIFEAWEILHKLSYQDVVTWNALIAGYAEYGLGNVVLSLVEQMYVEGISPNAATFVCSLKATFDLNGAFQIHAIVVKEGFENHPLVGNTLVDVYAKCGILPEAQDVFDELILQDAISLTTLISAYAEHMLHDEVLNCLDQMKLGNVNADCVVYLCSLKACGTIGAIHKGQEIHSEVIKKGFENDSFVANTLVDMYVKCGLLGDARTVFDKLSHLDVMPWTSIISGYARCGLCDESLKYLNEMQLRGLSPDVITWSAVIEGLSETKDFEKVFLLLSQMQEQCIMPSNVTWMAVLSVCGHSAALETGKKVHAQLFHVGSGAMDVDVATTLIDMYGKCGSMVDAQDLFEGMITRDQRMWNVLIAGYVRGGVIKPVSVLLEKMMYEVKELDETTFLSIYTLCAHGGLVGTGRCCFEEISKMFGIVATVEHYNCIIDLFSRAGQFYEALRVFDRMPSQQDLVTWITILTACQKWGHVEVGRQAFTTVVKLYRNEGAAYILMSNIFTAGED